MKGRAPRITDGSLYRIMRKRLPIKVDALNSIDDFTAKVLEYLINHNNELHYAALKAAKEDK